MNEIIGINRIEIEPVFISIKNVRYYLGKYVKLSRVQ